MRKLLLATCLALVMACGKNANKGDDAEFLDAAPETEAYLADVTGDDLSTQSNSLSSDVSQLEQGLETVPEYLQQVKTAVGYLNGTVRRIVEPIVEAIKADPSVSETGLRVWTKDRTEASYRFTLKKVATKKFGWKLEAKAKGAADSEYQAGMAGGIAVGAVARRGVGAMGIDADKLSAIDSSVKARGKLLVGFAHGATGAKALAYNLKDFTPDPAQYQKVSAVFRAVRGPKGATIVRLASLSNLTDKAKAGCETNATRELAVSRTRWVPEVGGRFDGVATNKSPPADASAGACDVEEGKFFVAQLCVDKDKKATHRRLRKCTSGQALDYSGPNCELIASEKYDATGAVTGEWPLLDPCFLKPELAEEIPVTAGNVPEDETSVPPDEASDEGLDAVTPPGEMPSGEG